MKHYIRLLLIVMVSTIGLSQATAQNVAGYDSMLTNMYRYTVPLITPEQVAFEIKRNSDIVLLDTREQQEYATSHITGARFAGYDKFDFNAFKDLPKDTKIIVYCSVGYRSERIGEQFKKAGFKQVYNIYGGFFNWANNGYPLVDAEGKPTTTVHGYNKNWGQWLNRKRNSVIW